jgi:hypothetical protein
MTDFPLITIERRRYAALVEALKLARYALIRSRRQFDCPPHDHYTVAHTIDRAIADATPAERPGDCEVRP